MKPRTHPLSSLLTGACLACSALAGGCGGFKMMPTPVMYWHGQVDPFADLPEQERSTELELFYATDRPASGPSNDRHYHDGHGPALRVGVATMQFGDSGMTWQALHEASTTRDRPSDVPIVLNNATEFGVLVSTVDPNDKDAGTLSDPAGEQAFADAINRRLAQLEDKDIIILVHGANAAFDGSSAETAQLAHFLGRDNVAINFAWPSFQQVVSYPLDKMEAHASVPNLVALLEFLADRTDVQRIHAIGYSAGAPLLAQALVRIRDNNPHKDAEQLRRDHKVGIALFTSADDSYHKFAHDEMKDFYDLPQTIEVTVSDEDNVLFVSRVLHLGSARVGGTAQVSDEDLAEFRRMDKLRVVDVTHEKQPRPADAGKFSGHFYWYDNPWVSSDIVTTLGHRLEPKQRGLEQMENGLEYYFPHDYPQRVVDAVGRE